MTRFDDVQARHAKATPGPWTWTGNERIGWQFGREESQDESGKAYSQADAEFIAHCPDDVGWLLDRVTQLETALRELDALKWREEVDMGGEYVTMKDRPHMDEVVGEIVRAALDTEQT